MATTKQATTKAAAKAAAPAAGATGKGKKKPTALSRRVRQVRRSGRKVKKTARALRRRVVGGTTRRGDLVVTTGPLGLTSSTARVRRRPTRRRRAAKPSALGRPTFAEEM